MKAIIPILKSCLEISAQRRVRARGLQELPQTWPSCRPGPLTGRPSSRPGLVLAAGLLLLLATIGMRANDIPSAINYQGRLTDNLGNPISTGYYEVQFKIWDDPTQSGSGDYIWGRSFAVHVVTNGLFNVLLSDGGGAVGTPQTNSILYAFAGPNRYLGLTVTMANGTAVTSPVEIAPRQQLVSAPFAIQAQSANLVGANGVGNSALANASVTTSKLASGAVAANNMAANAVTAGAIAAGAVTSAALAPGSVTSAALAPNSVTANALTGGSVSAAKLNIDQSFNLNDNTMFLRNPGDTNNGLGIGFNFQNAYVHGPVLFGFWGGLLTSTSYGNPALLWDAAGNVALGATTNAGADRLLINNGTARIPDHDLFLRSPGDFNHGLGWYGSSPNKLFSGVNVNGPVLYGFSGGALGSVQASNQATNTQIALTWKNNGRVGIGTSNPQAMLHVTGTTTNASGSANYFNFIFSNGQGTADASKANNVVGFFDGDLVASQSVFSMQTPTFSDARAKRVLGLSSGAKDLEALDQIQITDFQWIDQKQGGGRTFKKVIAQQVEQILPDAISKMRKPIPSVYAKAAGLSYDATEQRLSLTLDQNHGLQVGDKVDVYTDQGDFREVNVLETPSPKTFTIASPKAAHGAFIYGKWVDDYRMVDYDAISMLNVSATQELHRQLQEKDAEIRRLQAQIDELTAREERMAVRFAKLEELVSSAKVPIQKASLR